MKIIRLYVISVIIVTVLATNISIASANSDYSYPYTGKVFRLFVEDSYTEGHKGNPEQFYEWFETAFKKSGIKYPEVKTNDLYSFMHIEKERISNIKNTKKKTAEELRLAAYLHKVIKKVIPKFSLDRGFEFHATAKLGERQCLLQSVLISALLQEMGVDAGTVMVYRNIQGQYSFNGHVTVLLKLADGKDIIVDASDPIPFVKHTGILARSPEYLYLSPVYQKESSRITSFRSNYGNQIANAKVEPLKRNYVRSQFYYYRGERVPNGLLAKKKTKAGLEKSIKYLQISINYCKENALSYYMQGLAYSNLGEVSKAKSDFREAYRLQKKYSWIPEGLNKAIKQS